MPVVFGKLSAKHNSAFIMRAARETDNYKFRVILSRKVTGGFKSCKQYKGQLQLVTKTVGSTGPLVYNEVCLVLVIRESHRLG